MRNGELRTRKNERPAFKLALCTIREGYDGANAVRVDEITRAQLPEDRNFLTLLQWSSVVDSHENDKR